MQQGNWTQEVLLGTNADKIPGSALSSTLALPGTLSVQGAITTLANSGAPTGGPESLVISGNKSGGSAEVNFYNTFNAAGAGFDFWVFSGGAFAQALALATTGKLTGKGFYDSGIFSLVNGASTLLNHGLGARPRFYAGVYDTTSTDANLVSPVTPTVAAGVAAIYHIDASQIGAVGISGLTIYLRIFAML